MARYRTLLKMACGHEEYHDLNCTSREYENRLKWYEDVYAKERVCADCYKAEQDRIRQAEREKTKAESEMRKASMDLPELSGSEKQVAWAESIREKLLQQIEGLMKDALNPDSYREKVANIVRIALADGLADSLQAIFKYICSKDSARYFIDYWKNNPLAYPDTKNVNCLKYVKMPMEENDYNALVKAYYAVLADAKQKAKDGEQ